MTSDPMVRGKTARELLVEAAGDEHELHSPINLARSRQAISITCSCGKVFAIINNKEHLHILRHIPMLDATVVGSI